MLSLSGRLNPTVSLDYYEVGRKTAKIACSIYRTDDAAIRTVASALEKGMSPADAYALAKQFVEEERRKN